MKPLGSVGRFALLLATVVLVQSSLFAQLTFFGTVVDLALLVTVVAGFNGGADKGATVGFFAGFATDVTVHTPFGLTMLVLGLTGYFAGRFGPLVTEAVRAVRAFAAAIGVTAAVVMFGLLAWLLELEFVTRASTLRIAAVNATAAVVLNPLIERAVRWALRIRPHVSARASTWPVVSEKA